MRATTLLSATSISLLLLTGCVADEQPTPASSPTDDAQVPFQQVGQSEAQEVAVPYIGLSEADALAKADADGVTARVGTADDVGQPGLVEDYEIGRLTLVVSGGTVLEVIVEGDEGPITVAAS